MLELRKISKIKLSEDSAVYLGISKSNEKIIIKNLYTYEKIKRTNFERDVCLKLKSIDICFPCSLPEMYREDLYLENYIYGVTYGILDITRIQKEKASEKFVKLLETMRTLEPAKDSVERVYWKSYLMNQVERLLNGLRQKKFANQKYENTFAWTQKMVDKISDNVRLSLIHNGLHEENVLYNINKNGSVSVALIDFEKALWGDPLMDLSKLIWVFRRDSEYGSIFWRVYNEIMGHQDIEILKFYWCIDIMRHIFNCNKLIKKGNWKKMIREELIILEDIWQDEFELW